MLDRVLVSGDLSKLSAEQRVVFYNKTCESLGLNPLTKPFEYIKLNGKEVLYARRDCTDQLRNLRAVSVKITGREKVADVYMVTAQATTPAGRADESIGAVSILGLKGDALANAMMKAETKAKRRVTLSICGLGMLDETEIETIPATAKETTAVIQAPVQSVPADLGQYVMPIGKNKGRRLDDIELPSLQGFVDFMNSQMVDGKELSPKGAEALKNVEIYLQTLTDEDLAHG
jgi:hypothetical protein